MPTKPVPKTLEEIEALPKQMLRAADIYLYLSSDPNLIRWQAQHDPEN